MARSTGTPTLPELGMAAGLVAILLFAILGLVSDSGAALIAGCGFGLLLFLASFAATRYTGDKR